MSLSTEQQSAINLIKSGNSVFITSRGAGCGKTFLLNEVIQQFKTSDKKVAVTASTGVAAVLLNGRTLHSWSSIGLGNKSTEQICRKIMSNKTKKNRWLKTDILIIDEISLISPELFDKLEEIARIIRNNDKPFGGIQLILSGDWLQLQTIDSENYTFESLAWSKCIDKTVYLTEIFRQKDADFQEVLNSIRVGRITKKVKSILRSRVGIKLENIYGIIPTKLYSLNVNVDEINNRELEKLIKKTSVQKEVFDIKWISKKQSNSNRQTKIDQFFSKKHTNNDDDINSNSDDENINKTYLKMCNAVGKLELCKGAQVMLLANLDQEQKLVNGARGVVMGFNNNNLPIVRFLNGVEEIIEYKSWEIENGNKLVGTFEQIPLKLAYATTIHKAQGSTLDYVEINLENLFELSQGYVGLSRVKSLEGLSIKGLRFDKLQVNIKALKYYQQLEKKL